MEKQHIDEAIEELDANELVIVAKALISDMYEMRELSVKYEIAQAVILLLLASITKRLERNRDRLVKHPELMHQRTEQTTRRGPEWPSNSVTGPKGLTHNPFEGALAKLKEKTG